MYYYKNIAWYKFCINSNIDIKTLDKIFEGTNYSIKKHKMNKELTYNQQKAIEMIIKDGKKPNIKLIREYLKNM